LPLFLLLLLFLPSAERTVSEGNLEVRPPVLRPVWKAAFIQYTRFMPLRSNFRLVVRLSVTSGSSQGACSVAGVSFLCPPYNPCEIPS
jgi:hypothetical protein